MMGFNVAQIARDAQSVGKIRSRIKKFAINAFLIREVLNELFKQQEV
jgi:hypothetical protein